jgi:mono/diheme cytochrome c family protein
LRAAAATLGLAVLASAASAASAQVIDPHALYEGHCAGCHAPHAGAFVRDSLERRGDALVGLQTGRELRSVLESGHGRLSAAEIDAMVAHLGAVAESGGLFRDRCAICHGRAVEFARRWLAMTDGRLVGRFTGREIRSFLRTHGRLGGGDIETVARMLERQLTTGAGD